MLPTIRLSLVGAKWWICDFGGSVAKNPKTSFVTIGMLAPKTGLITILNTILTPTMKPIAAPMRASGTRLTHDCVPTSPNHWSSGFPSKVFSQFFIFHFILFFSTSRMLLQGCVDHLTLTMDRPFQVRLTEMSTPPIFVDESSNRLS